MNIRNVLAGHQNGRQTAWEMGMKSLKKFEGQWRMQQRFPIHAEAALFDLVPKFILVSSTRVELLTLNK